MGSISSPDENGYRHFEFRVFFPFQYAHYYSIGFESSELDTDYQILRMGMQIKEVLTYNAGEVKQL
jgi:hypothetical protein